MQDIVGTWRLVATAAHDPEGAPLPPPYGTVQPMGVVTLTADGRMMAVLCDGRPAVAGDDAPREYASYCGTYSFDGERLTTRVDASSDPVRFAVDQVRRVSFDGARMVLRPPAQQIDGVLRQRILTWEKISPR